MPSKVLDGQIPFQILHKEQPSFDKLRSFGCLCYVSPLPQGRDKFMPRVNPCILIGYPPVQKAYKVLYLVTKSISISRDVKFFENNFSLHSSDRSISFPDPNSFILIPIFDLVVQNPDFTPDPNFVPVLIIMFLQLLLPYLIHLFKNSY